MNKVNQVLLIEKFLLSNQETLIINQVNDDYGLFYLSVIKYYADKDGIKINIDDDNRTLGTENDLAKVMVSQQVSSLAFQLTLNVRNKALSAYKDIMNMPV